MAPNGVSPQEEDIGAFRSARLHQWELSLRGARCCPPGAVEDLIHDIVLGVGVVLHVGPVLGCQLQRDLRVEVAIGIMCADMIAEAQVPRRLLRATREDMQVDVRIRALEDAMLFPLRFADAKDVSGFDQGAGIRGLVAGIFKKLNVDDRFRREAGHGS